MLTAPELPAPEPAAPGWLTDGAPECADCDVISLGGTADRADRRMCRTMINHLIVMCRTKSKALSARARNYTIGVAFCGAVIVAAGVLGTVRPGVSSGSGTAGCEALSGAHHMSAADFPRIRSQFSDTQWPDLRLAGTSYIDLLVKLRTARGTDGYEAVWFYQRLAIACARHGQKMRTPLPPRRHCHNAPDRAQDAARKAPADPSESSQVRLHGAVGWPEVATCQLH